MSPAGLTDEKAWTNLSVPSRQRSWELGVSGLELRTPNPKLVGPDWEFFVLVKSV